MLAAYKPEKNEFKNQQIKETHLESIKQSLLKHEIHSDELKTKHRSAQTNINKR